MLPTLLDRLELNSRMCDLAVALIALGDSPRHEDILVRADRIGSIAGSFSNSATTTLPIDAARHVEHALA